jgi:hypothetical protein
MSKDQELPPLVERMSSLFSGLDRAYGKYELLKRPAGGKKVPGKAQTLRGPVTHALWHQHLLGQQGLGIVPIRDGNTAVFGAIDIDRYDLKLEEVEKQCAQNNLPLLPTRTKSGGVHLYAFTSEPVPAALLKQRLEEWSVTLGYGGAEVFPKQATLLNDKDIGNWINMPYFAALSDTPVDRYGVWKGKPLSLLQFVQRAEQLRITEEQLEQLHIAEGEEFREGPPCLQSMAKSGFGEGMRNNGMFAVGVYLKKRFPDDWQQQMALYNARFMKPPLAEGELKQITKALGRKDYGYTCDKAPCKQFCNKALCRTREHGVGSGQHDDWGLVIDDDVLRINTVPPYWVVTVNGTRMQLFSEDIMQQRRFQEMCVQNIAYFPPTLPGDKWRAEINKILQAAAPVEAPDDASAHGELAYHLRQFFTVFPQAETREELLVGKPFTEEGLTMFRAADFKRFLDAQHFRALSGAKMYAELRKLGLSHRQLWVAGQNVLVWAGHAVEQSTTPPPDEKQQHDNVVPLRRAKKSEGAM